MLDNFEILTTSGVVLWSKSYVPISQGIINSFINDVFIEEKVLKGANVADDKSAPRNPAYKREKYTLKWTSVKDLGLIFVAVYQSLLNLSWIDELLDNIKVIFVDLYRDQLKKPHTSVVECDFDSYFDQQVCELESSAEKGPQRTPDILIDDLTPPSSSGSRENQTPPPIPGLASGKQKPLNGNSTSTDVTPIPTPDTSRPTTPLNNHLLSAKGGPKGLSRRAKKAANTSNLSSADEASGRRSKPGKGAPKAKRIWGAEGYADEDTGEQLDYSAATPIEEVEDPISTSVEPIDASVHGTRTGKGQYILKDLDDEVHSILQGANEKQSDTSASGGVVGSSLSAISGLFRNVVGGKVLSKADLDKPMKGMEEHLLNKNVAREAAVRLCDGVERELVGVKTGSFESIDTRIRASLASSLRKILTPTTSLDILHSITAVTSPGSAPLSPSHRPYVISVVGVNGVGKSTNLSKLAFFLIQNRFNLLIAACDTFRSGAVEQLRVHARNLKELSQREGLGKVELYEKGYGKDAANIAKDAVAYAASQQFDVVLIDTAGRRHNDARLMSSLEKFAQFARPDKILMVGEALVGTDSVAQARSFNEAFGKGRGLDGFIIRVEMFLITAAATVLTCIFLYWKLRPSVGAAIDFSVALPEPGKEVLNEPSIKCPGSSAVQCYCPADGRLLGLVNPASPDGIDRAVAKAKDAQKGWANTTFKQRRQVLRTMLKFILENQETIATVACLDSGKTKIDAILGEILVTVEKLKWTIQHGEKALKPERRPTNFLMMYKANEVRWEPLGVVAACVSWNYPFHNFMGPTISSLFSGSAILVKASEQTAWSLSYFASIARGALTACGHSPNLIQPLVCWPSVANHLTSHLSISHITFIGSRQVAHAVCASAAKSLTPVCVELGGKDAAIILDDVKNMEKVASILMRGVFQSAGQNCIGIERIVALPKAYSSLISILEPRIRSLRIGHALDDPDGVDVGAMVTNASFDRLEHLIADAVKHGAKCLVGGKRYTHPKYPKGHYFSPSLLVDVTNRMPIAHEELFAPVCIVIRAVDVDEALSIANSTPYGLGASVFGSNKQDLDRCAREVQAGMVAVNDFAVFYAVQLPFGGVKGSGYGRFAGEEGLRALCNTKSVCRDRWPLISTSIPAALDYPIEYGQKSWEFAKGIVELGYTEGVAERVKAVERIIRNS